KAVHPPDGRLPGQALSASPAHSGSPGNPLNPPWRTTRIILVSATLRTCRTDRVASLFLPSRATLIAERALDKQIRTLVTGFLQEKTVAAPADLAALAQDFADSEAPREPVTPARYVEQLAANVVPYSNRIAAPRSLAHMNQGLPYFMRPLARLLTAMN